MSNFNKGDFTQQGVDGHVRATLRLNEKRYVNLDLTTNENARGCTISGNVHDRLNNLDYPIGAAPSGNIEITENTEEGEPLDISQYATATVNVAGGGATIKTMPVTIINNTSYTVFIRVPHWLNSGYLQGGIEIPTNETATIDTNIFYVPTDELYSVLLDGSTSLSSQEARFDTDTSTATYATLDFDGDYCEIALTSPPNPDATATIYIANILS